ncbi:MAG: cytochrome C oxidase subunit IV family protein [Anaeromyxobacteraceae bacterium]
MSDALSAHPERSAAAGGAESRGHSGTHVLSPKVLLTTAGALFGLTLLTVAVSLVDLGHLNIAVALGVATVKAILVAGWFMHLRYEGRFNLVVLVGCALFAIFMIGFIVFDTTEYQPDLRAHDAAQVQKK